MINIIQYVNLSFIFEDTEIQTPAVPEKAFRDEARSRPNIPAQSIDDILNSLNLLSGWQRVGAITHAYAGLVLSSSKPCILPFLRPFLHKVPGRDGKPYLCFLYGFSLHDPPQDAWLDVHNTIKSSFLQCGVHWVYEGACLDNSFLEEYHKVILMQMSPEKNDTVGAIDTNKPLGLQSDRDIYRWVRRTYMNDKNFGTEVPENEIYALFNRDSITLSAKTSHPTPLELAEEYY